MYGLRTVSNQYKHLTVNYSEVMSTTFCITLFSSWLLLASIVGAQSRPLDVRSFGAKGDGVSDISQVNKFTRERSTKF